MGASCSLNFPWKVNLHDELNTKRSTQLTRGYNRRLDDMSLLMKHDDDSWLATCKGSRRRSGRQSSEGMRLWQAQVRGKCNHGGNAKHARVENNRGIELAVGKGRVMESEATGKEFCIWSTCLGKLSSSSSLLFQHDLLLLSDNKDDQAINEGHIWPFHQRVCMMKNEHCKSMILWSKLNTLEK